MIAADDNNFRLWETNIDDDEVFVLGPLHDEMMEDLLQGGCYK